jgi:hypothetical protein
VYLCFQYLPSEGYNLIERKWLKSKPTAKSVTYIQYSFLICYCVYCTSMIPRIRTQRCLPQNNMADSHVFSMRVATYMFICEY